MPTNKELEKQVATLGNEVSALTDKLSKQIAVQERREVEGRVQQAKVPKLEKVPLPEPPPKPPKAVVFHSPHAEFKQVIVPSKTEWHGTERFIIPEVIVNFAPLGSARVEKPEHVELMRERKKLNDSRGIQTPWVEVSDEFADLAPVQPVKNENLDITASMEDAQMTPGFTPSQLAGE